LFVTIFKLNAPAGPRSFAGFRRLSSAAGRQP
jgi:hypothetical protein